MAKRAFMLIFCLVLANAQSYAQNRIDSALKSFDAFYLDSLSKNAIVGSSFMLVHENQILDQQFFGLYDLENKRAVDENTIYHWASITKTFTGIAIMQLRDRGLLKLDDPVIKYVPELREVHDPFGDKSEITIRHLLSHSAGFRSATWPWAGDKDWQPFEPPRWDQLVAMMPYTEVEFKPGSKFSYSNLGIIFLGRIIESLSHDPYQAYIDKNILKPLEMYRSYFDHTPYHLLKYRAHSYRVRDGKTIPAVFDADTGITVSNGGLNAPLTDMVKYVNFLIGNQRKQEVYDGVLKRSSLEEMWAPQLPTPDQTVGGRGRKDAVGLIFFLEDNFDQHFVAHSGYQNAFKTHLYLNPATRTAYLIAYNTYVAPTKENPDIDTDKLDNRIKDYLFEHVFPLFKK